MERPADTKSLFEQCSFIVVRGAGLEDQEAKKILETLRLHGGQATTDEYPGSHLDLKGVTHIISSTSDFPDYHAATDSLIPVIRPQWIEISLAKDRLAHTRQFCPDPRLFMSDVVACCADLPEGDADAIAGGIIAMGGNFTSKTTSLVTHVVALTMDNDMCETVVQRKMDAKIVLPHWFDDCLKLGRKIDERPYQLPDPDILQIDQAKAPAGGQKNKLVTGAVDPHPEKEKLAPPKRQPVSIFKDKTFMLSQDLGIGPYLRGVMEGIITGSDGHIADDVKKADYLVCKYREGQDYKTASRLGLDVGNLGWFYFLVLHDQWTSPMRRLLHYPVVKGGLPGFLGKKISLSNYSGEARTYLENLITATGAECTKTLRQENTHLITAHDQSEKCAAARDWNVHMINHLWLEESYAKWQIQSETIPRYTHFPKRTNLGEVVGQTQIDRKVLEQFWANDHAEVSNAMPANSFDRIQKVADAEQDVPASSPPPPQAKAKSKARAKSKQLQEGNGNSSGTDGETLKTPTVKRHVAAGKENITPMTTGSRRSKEVAAAKLHQMTPDIALYEKEKKRSGGVVYGGRRKGPEKEERTSRKRSVDAIDSDDTDETESKRPRQDLPQISTHLLISGYKKWYNKPKQEDMDTKQLRDLGIMIVSDPAKATHLAIPNLVRTPKAVVALAYAPVLISTDFIDACLEKDDCLDPADYELKDKAGEEKLGVSLKSVRERAKKNQQQLLQGRSVYVVDKIAGGFESFQAIVEANGGQCMTYRGRRGTMVPSRRGGGASSDVDDPQNEVYLLSGDAKEDAKLWPQFVKMAEGSRKIPRIVKTDWLLDSAMCQKIQPTASYELDGKT